MGSLVQGGFRAPSGPRGARLGAPNNRNAEQVPPGKRTGPRSCSRSPNPRITAADGAERPLFEQSAFVDSTDAALRPHGSERRRLSASLDGSRVLAPAVGTARARAPAARDL